MNLTPRIQTALETAARLHDGHKRRGNGLPYFTHPLSVALLAARYTEDEDLLVAALLHDTVEDIESFTIADVERDFGPRVATLVWGLTETVDLSDCDHDPRHTWDYRKKSYLKKLEGESAEVKLLCAADKIHNLESIERCIREYGIDFLKSFHTSPEKQLWFFGTVLAVLEETLAHPLVARYREAFERVSSMIDTASKQRIS
jgi:(p)ppGpp synthase/HD superfamily hydrolase